MSPSPYSTGSQGWCDRTYPVHSEPCGPLFPQRQPSDDPQEAVSSSQAKHHQCIQRSLQSQTRRDGRHHPLIQAPQVSSVGPMPSGESQAPGLLALSSESRQLAGGSLAGLASSYTLAPHLPGCCVPPIVAPEAEVSLGLLLTHSTLVPSSHQCPWL